MRAEPQNRQRRTFEPRGKAACRLGEPAPSETVT